MKLTMFYKRRDAGFTLVETLAGFAILTLAMTVLMAGMTTAFRRDATSQVREEQLRLARGQLDSAGVQWPLSGGVTTGSLPGGYQWTVTTLPYSSPSFRPSPEPTQAFWIEVAISAPNSRAPAVRLQTLRLLGVKEE